MKHLVLSFAFSALIASGAAAYSPMMTVSAAERNTQTIHHCGYLPTSATHYTHSPVLARVVERKLSTMGYAATVDGYWGKADQNAVKAFQRDYGLPENGVVGPETAQRIAYMGHPNAHVRGCQRMANR